MSLRTVSPLTLPAIVPLSLNGKTLPRFLSVDPRTLLVDDSYQRNLSERSVRLISKIVAKWDWARFKPPVVVDVDGELHLIDGQHTAIAAVTHGGIPELPVMVVEAPKAEDRARAFVGHNRDRLTVTVQQLHFAEVAAGDEDALTVDQVCKRAGVWPLRVPPSRGLFQPGQTIAFNTIRALISKHGVIKARQVLEVLVAAKCAPISADQIKAVAELMFGADYQGLVSADRLSDVIRSFGAEMPVEVKQLAAARRLPLWRALVIVIANRRARNVSRNAA